MKEFKNYHPLVNFIYFLLVIGFSMFYMHPLFLIISFLCSFTYAFVLKGKKEVLKSLLYLIPLVILTAVMNPLFNHEGATILCYLSDGNPLTLESVYYGIAASLILVNVITWFSCYNEIMTSDKFIYIFGRIIPSLSLVFSMTLRFVPRFKTQLKEVSTAQKCIGKGTDKGGVIKRVRNALSHLLSMTTWALENSAETADSMKARGYGLKGRTAFSVFRFSKRDLSALLFLILSGGIVIFGSIRGITKFRFFPTVKSGGFGIMSVIVFTFYFILMIYPVIIEIREVRKWKALKSKA